MRAFTYFTAAIAAVSMAGCAVHQTEAPGLSGPSQSALTLSVSSSPQTLTQNGFDTATITAKLFFTDPNTGQTAPKANVPVRLDMQVGGVAQDYGTLSCRSGVTGVDGVVVCAGSRPTYTAPPMPVGGTTGNGCNGVPGQCIAIIATTTDTTAANNSGVIASNAVVIALVPPGVILPPAGTPKAAFTFLPDTISVGQAVTFDASTSCATDASGNCSSSGSIVTYAWNFGDGAIGAGKTVTHTFTSGSTFVVTLTVTSDRGLSASTSQGIPVGLPTAPSADFVVSPAQPVAGQTVFFSAETSHAASGHNITQYSWNYGDGSTDSGVTVSHAFALPGSYNVILSISDDTGQRSTKTTAVIVATAAPIAKLSLTKSGMSVTADASLSTPSNGVAIATYVFNFGDGSGNSAPTSAAISAPHTYGAIGSYTVTVVVTDVQGHSSSTSASITVP